MNQTSSSTPVFEIAVYEVKDPDALAANQHRLHEMRPADAVGFVRCLTVRSTTEVDVFANVTLWADQATATAAAVELQSGAGLAWFTAAISTTRFFDYFETDGAAEITFDRIASAALVEIAASKPADPSAYGSAHAHLHADLLSGRDGVVGNIALPINQNGVAADLVGWTNQSVHESTGEEMMADPALASFFDPANELVVFMTFEASTR